MGRRTFLIAIATVAVAVNTVAIAPATSAAPVGGDHCVVHVTGQQATGELTTGPARCYASHAEAMSREGVAAWGTDAYARAALADFEIGLHCDGYNLGAPCTSVVGSGCTGGWLNVSAAWNNRISSTRNGCPQIRHFDLANLGGVSYTTGAGSHNLTAFNNRTTSIQYL